MHDTTRCQEEGSSQCTITVNMCFIIVYYDGHRHVVIFGAESIDSLLERGATVNLTNGPMGVVGNRNSVEVGIAEGCWDSKTSCSTFAHKNVITWSEIVC